MNRTDQATEVSSRREFLQESTATLAAAAVAPYLSPLRAHVSGSDLIKVGLIGCGGRGTGAAVNALKADPNVRLVAMADAFTDYLEGSLASLKNNPEIASKVAVDSERKFVGFDSYKGVIESCDVVLLCTSPHFRPQHVKAAVDAGRHLFVEKPVAVDGPGVRSVRESCTKARDKGLIVVSGLCYRYERAKRETLKRIHDGAIGDIVAMQCSYNTGGLWHRGRQSGWSDMEFQMRNWLYFNWLSGDHIAEQHIHSLDKLAWAMKDENPVRCTSSGGRVCRTSPDYGNVYDHFNTVYEWKNGVKGFSSCRQWVGAAADVSDHCFGTQGVAHIQTHEIEGRSAWRLRRRPEEEDDMYQNEHDEMFAAIRERRPINNGEYMCNSTLMAIMGRMAAYTGQTITWEQALSSTEDLTPSSYQWGPLPVAPVAVPGVTKFL